ncbi:hypothetical protein sce4085 [Sorangium cellulosum So ce56]|uniref:Uncharacterized protein n=1 Tax=Sorangium cellulosum (strain So ce56) TaxID=448385 RepID=A9EVR0_SORC5|nr:hypothetical protein [Sorangium cellulosum]CAN94248.1 hypothetical protein sce4085 [Sorangium cellulosum So ce56]
MQSISDALNVLHDDAAWFARAREVRLLVVRTSGDLRGAVLDLLPGFEFHADNRSPWIVLDDARTGEDAGWIARSNRLAAAWERRREAYARDGIEVGPVPLPASASLGQSPAAAGPSPYLAVFELMAGAVLRALRGPLQGLVLVVAPTIIDDARALDEEIARLLAARELLACRIVLVLDLDDPPPRRATAVARPLAVETRCAVDARQKQADFAAFLASASDGARASGGVVGPRGVAPPRRVDAPPELPLERRDAILRGAGINPAYLDGSARLRDQILGAALAMQQGNGPDAIAQQRSACDLAASVELGVVEVICRVTLASYLSALDRSEAAVEELDRAVSVARAHRLPEQESQALLALGLVHALAQRFPDAARAYVHAARTAEAAGAALLAIEGWRLAGQLALLIDAEDQAIDCLKKAVQVAADSEPTIARLSSGPEAARRLAALCRARGWRTQAASLDEQADRLERGRTTASPTQIGSAGG